MLFFSILGKCGLQCPLLSSIFYQRAQLELRHQCLSTNIVFIHGLNSISALFVLVFFVFETSVVAAAAAAVSLLPTFFVVGKRDFILAKMEEQRRGRIEVKIQQQQQPACRCASSPAPPTFTDNDRLGGGGGGGGGGEHEILFSLYFFRKRATSSRIDDDRVDVTLHSLRHVARKKYTYMAWGECLVFHAIKDTYVSIIKWNSDLKHQWNPLQLPSHMWQQNIFVEELIAAAAIIGSGGRRDGRRRVS